MSQHDYNIANASGSSFRADLNLALGAIATSNGGASAPSVTFAHMLWFDETNNALKIRNTANTAWLTIIIDPGVTNQFGPTSGGTSNGNIQIPYSDGFPIITWRSGSTIKGQFMVFMGSGTFLWDAPQGFNIRDTINGGGTDLLALSNTGSLKPKGLLDLTTATAGQIGFPASQNASAGANVFDDYEEGSWTPNVGGTATYTSQVSTYSKNANRVLWDTNFSINVLGTGSATTIGGAPFTCSGGNTIGYAAYWLGLASAVVYLSCYIQGSTTNFFFVNAGSAVTGSSAGAALLTSGTQVLLSGCYKA